MRCTFTGSILYWSHVYPDYRPDVRGTPQLPRLPPRVHDGYRRPTPHRSPPVHRKVFRWSLDFPLSVPGSGLSSSVSFPTLSLSRTLTCQSSCRFLRPSSPFLSRSGPSHPFSFRHVRRFRSRHPLRRSRTRRRRGSETFILLVVDP